MSHAPTFPRFWGFVASRAADDSRIDAFLMICEILHPIFDALDDEFGFHGFGLCGELQTGRENKKDRLTMPKFCTALNKEKRFRYPPNLRIGITKGKSKHMRKSCCYCKSQIRYCQEVGNIQILRRIKQRKGSEKRNNFNRCRQNAYSIAP